MGTGRGQHKAEPGVREAVGGGWQGGGPAWWQLGRKEVTQAPSGPQTESRADVMVLLGSKPPFLFFYFQIKISTLQGARLQEM